MPNNKFKLQFESIDRLTKTSRWNKFKNKIDDIMNPSRIFTVNGEVTPLFTTKFKLQLSTWILFLVAWSFFTRDVQLFYY